MILESINQLRGISMQPAAFVFPGQGSQRQGMGADLLARAPRYRRLIADANRLSGVDVTRTLRVVPDGVAGAAGPSTVATQLSVFALSVSLGQILLDGGIWPQVVAGHSLGEYSALVVGGWLDVDAGLELVAQRAAAMERCCGEHDGVMSAIVGLGETAIADVVRGTGAVLANVNSPRQVVISGTRGAVADAVALAYAAGASTAVELPVAGAFHSPYMAAAQAALAGSIERLALRKGSTPLVSSMTGRVIDDLGAYRAQLAGQITATVRWNDVMAEIAGLGGGRSVVEVGPGAVLRGLFRQLDRSRPVATCGCLADCDDRLADRISVADDAQSPVRALTATAS
jgi:[acyl-carrier-protein] S-malonyltransferase